MFSTKDGPSNPPDVLVFNMSQLLLCWPTRLCYMQLVTGLCLTLQVNATMSFFKHAAKKVEGGVKDAADKVGNGCKDAAKKVEDGVKDTADKVGDGCKDAAKKVEDGVKDATDKVGNGCKDAGDEAGDVTKQVVDKIKEGEDIIGDNFKVAVEKIGELVVDIAQDPHATAKIAAGAVSVTYGSIQVNAGQPIPGFALIVEGTVIIGQVIWSKVDDGQTTFQLHKDMQGEPDDIKRGLVNQAVKKFGEFVREAFSEYLKV